MSWKNIKEAIYSDVNEMTVANGYNYDWSTNRRTDSYIPISEQAGSTSPDVSFILEYPDDGSPLFEDKSKEGGISSRERRMKREVRFVARVTSDMTVIDAENLIDLNNDAIDKALDDILKKFCGKVMQQHYCENGVRSIEPIQGFKRAIESKSAYLPYELVVIYLFDYKESRC